MVVHGTTRDATEMPSAVLVRYAVLANQMEKMYSLQEIVPGFSGSGTLVLGFAR